MIHRWAMAAALVFGVAGCDRLSVEDVCERLEQCEGGVGADCRKDGEAVESLAADRDCDEEFSQYLDCVDAQGCGYETACGTFLQTLEACMGDLPGA